MLCDANAVPARCRWFLISSSLSTVRIPAAYTCVYTVCRQYVRCVRPRNGTSIRQSTQDFTTLDAIPLHHLPFNSRPFCLSFLSFHFCPLHLSSSWAWWSVQQRYKLSQEWNPAKSAWCISRSKSNTFHTEDYISY